MRAVLIPVKEFSRAKERLAAYFSATERQELAAAMLDDFFGVVAAVRGIEQVFVVSAEPLALERARRLGWEIILESRQLSESDSVDFASRWCTELGVRALLRLPIDLPLAEPRDIEAIFDELPPSPAAVLVPSRDGDGTNALLRSPPTLFPSHFGPGSFARHMAEAAGCGAQVRVLRNTRLELDVDEMEDLRVLAAHPPRRGSTSAWLRKFGSRELRSWPQGASQLAATTPCEAAPESAGRSDATRPHAPDTSD